MPNFTGTGVSSASKLETLDSSHQVAAAIGVRKKSLNRKVRERFLIFRIAQSTFFELNYDIMSFDYASFHCERNETLGGEIQSLTSMEVTF